MSETVYAVIHKNYADEGHVVGVYSTRDLAREHLKHLENAWKMLGKPCQRTIGGIESGLEKYFVNSFSVLTFCPLSTQIQK